MAVQKRKKLTLEQIIAEFEKKQENLIKTTMRQIMLLFDEKVTEVAFLYAQRRLINNRFLPKDIRKTIERISNTINARTRQIIINSIETSFRNSAAKNDIIEFQVATNGRRIPPGKRVRFIAGQSGSQKGTITAVDEYIKRKTKGLGLSKRIWKLSPSFKKTVNDVMLEGLKKGTPARVLAKDLRKSLRNNTVTENPGKGVYKSPQKNAERVTRSEINLAYANADFERWQLVDSIIGIEVRLSNSHVVFDICDPMAGKYPKDFHFTRWHPQCKCIAVPILAPQDVRDAIMDYKLGLIDEPPVIPYITTMPKSAEEWMKKNAARVKGWKNTPYFVSSNPKYVDRFFK